MQQHPFSVFISLFVLSSRYHKFRKVSNWLEWPVGSNLDGRKEMKINFDVFLLKLKLKCCIKKIYPKPKKKKILLYRNYSKMTFNLFSLFLCTLLFYLLISSVFFLKHQLFFSEKQIKSKTKTVYICFYFSLVGDVNLWLLFRCLQCQNRRCSRRRCSHYC